MVFFSSLCFQHFVCVTGDHSTPVLHGDHSFEAVPFTICAIGALPDHEGGDPKDGCLVDQVQNFNEIEASGGILGRFPGSEVMEIIKRFIILK